MDLVKGKEYKVMLDDGRLILTCTYLGRWDMKVHFKEVGTGKPVDLDLIILEGEGLELSDVVLEVPLDSTAGVKYDGGKLSWGLLPLEPVQEIVKVLTYGAKKYAPNNWLYVKNAKDRYWDAMMRHLTAWKMGQKADQDTGINHLAHAGCCLLFMFYFDLFPEREQKETEQTKEEGR